MRLRILAGFVLAFSFICFGKTVLAKTKEDPIKLKASVVKISFPKASFPYCQAIKIPFQLVNRLIVVDAQIGELKGKFLLDTGAEKMLLNLRYFEPNTLKRDRAWVGVMGIETSIFQKEIERLYLAQTFFPDHQIHFLDLSHIEKKRKIKLLGVIGYDILSKFEFLIDFNKKEVILYRLDKKGAPFGQEPQKREPIDSMTFELVKHLVILQASLGGRRLQMALDSGAEYNLLEKRVSKKVLAHFEAGAPLQLTTASAENIKVHSGTLHRLNCGPFENLSMRTLLINMDSITKSVGIKIDGILGYEFLKQMAIAVNYKKKKLYFFH